MTQATKEQAIQAFNTLVSAADLAPLNRSTHDLVRQAATTIQDILKSVYEPATIPTGKIIDLQPGQ